MVAFHPEVTLPRQGSRAGPQITLFLYDLDEKP